MSPDEVAELRAEMKQMADGFHKLDKSVGMLIENAQHTETSCPYRVQVARNTNGIKEAREDAKDALLLAQNNRVGLAKIGIAAGGGVTFGGAIVALAVRLLS